ncbi:serine/threonine-protein kinase [Actinomadura violacea]|uniref:non-specific serine/threonine protein kinase n=1 Tax=Actinomadura violacea TaxID=2819934 RepID=A0ABS3RUL9_9ACTN|nr:serine/threonine-protein kinase [Actinomadura violacea]MBO2460460.1 serine/threonine protein kinase [Actinomadura violacea]
MAFNVADGWTVPGFTHERELGDGAAGRVVLAVDDMTSTKVAIRYLAGALRADEAFMARFRASSRTLSQLEDPNVADLYDFIEAPDGAAVVMQYVDGVALRRVLAAQGPTGPLAALSMLGGTLLGLAAAHGLDVVHGAVRPSAVLIDGDGNASLTDFGTAAAGTEAQLAPAYAAPELWDGAAATVATDLYAAAAVFFECLTGHPPFAGRNMARLHREAAIPVEEVPGPLRELIGQGLAKDPEQRPKTAADFLGALEEAAVSAYGPSWEAQGRGRLTELAAQAAQQPEPPKAKPSRSSGRHQVIATGEGPPRASRGRRLVGSVAALAVVAAIAGGVVYLNSDDGDATPPTPSPAQSSTPQPSLPPGGIAPAPLAARITQATGQAPGARFSYRRTGCCGAPAAAQGSFDLVQGAEPSYSMTMSGSGKVRKRAQAVVVGDRVFLRAGKKWRPAAAGGRGYPALAEQVRRGSSVSAVTTLLNAAASLSESGGIYKGEAPVAKLAQAPGSGALYAEMAGATGVQEISFALKLDGSGRPAKLWLRAGPAKGRNQIITTSYSGWGRKAIKAPR